MAEPRAHPKCQGPEGHVCQKPSGHTCVESGCLEPAGTWWTKHWCPHHDEERLNRITQQLNDLVGGLSREKALPEPRCRLGYPTSQVREILGSDQEWEHFRDWMTGQTIVMCNGYSYDHDTEQHVRTCEAEEWPGGGHGPVYYTDDVRRFMFGLPVID